MRIPRLLGFSLAGFFLAACLWAKPFNEAAVVMLDGTVMDQPGDGSKPFALQTTSTVAKGDILTCYDQSWVILKTHKGDQIGVSGFDGPTVVSVDEYYIEGPDRQIRLVLQKGTLFLKANNVGSPQSFFEINIGSVVASIGDTQAILSYDSSQSHLNVQYIRGKLTVIDKVKEHKFGVPPNPGNHVVNIKDKNSIQQAENEDLEYIPQDSEYNWKNGTLADEGPTPLDPEVMINYNRFFEGQPPLPPPENDILLKGSS